MAAAAKRTVRIEIPEIPERGTQAYKRRSSMVRDIPDANERATLMALKGKEYYRGQRGLQPEEQQALKALEHKLSFKTKARPLLKKAAALITAAAVAGAIGYGAGRLPQGRAETTRNPTAIERIEPSRTETTTPKPQQITQQQLDQKNKAFYQQMQKNAPWVVRDVTDVSTPNNSHQSTFISGFLGANSEAIKREMLVREGKRPPEDSAVAAARSHITFCATGPFKTTPNMNGGPLARQLAALQQWADAIDSAAQHYTIDEINMYVSGEVQGRSIRSIGEYSQNQGETLDAALRMAGIKKYGNTIVPPGPAYNGPLD